MIYAWICCPYFSLTSIITVGTRFLGVKALTSVTNGVFSFLPAKGHQFLLIYVYEHNAYGLLYTLLCVHHRRFSRPSDLFIVRTFLSVLGWRDLILYWSAQCRITSSWLVFVLTVKESSNLTFCGKYYSLSTNYKRLSTIRLMNAVSWRNIPLHRGPSHFAFIYRTNDQS